MKYIVTLFLIVPFLSFAEIYKWTDQQGKVHFGDSPENKSNVEKVTVEVNSYKNVTYEDTEIYQGTESPRVTMYATSWCGYCKKPGDILIRRVFLTLNTILKKMR